MHNPSAISVDELIERYAVFFIDQFGVLHDGRTPYPGAIRALGRIKQSGRRVVLLSNSGKRSQVNEARLETLGFQRDSYDVFLTSGEVAWQQLHTTLIGQSIPAGGTCLVLARDDDASAIEGLNLKRVTSTNNADVILLSGCRDELSMADYDALLHAGLKRGVPCLCTNPDKHMLTPAGIKFGAGAIAERYAEQGGAVTWIGKPYPAIYRTALATIDNPATNTVVCLGDSVEHDIAGGQGAGLATALVQTGIAESVDHDARQKLYEQFSVAPDYLLDAFAV